MKTNCACVLNKKLKYSKIWWRRKFLMHSNQNLYDDNNHHHHFIIFFIKFCAHACVFGRIYHFRRSFDRSTNVLQGWIWQTDADVKFIPLHSTLMIIKYHFHCLKPLPFVPSTISVWASFFWLLFLLLSLFPYRHHILSRHVMVFAIVHASWAKNKEWLTKRIKHFNC